MYLFFLCYCYRLIGEIKIYKNISKPILSVSDTVSPEGQNDSVIYNVSDWLRDFVSGSEPRDVSLLYASDRKLFNVTSPSGHVRFSKDRANSKSAHSLALLAEYPPDLSVIFLLCFKMAAEDGTKPLQTSSYREITIQVSENVPIGTTLVHDLGSMIGVHGNRRYDITSGNDAGLFEIDHVTGNITTRAEVDYEQQTLHRLVVRITETETDYSVTGIPTFAVVVVSVDDVNEYRPVFPVPVYRRSVFGSQKTGSFVTTVRAIDRDAGRYGRLRYRPQLPTSSFVVDRTSGHVWLGNPVAMTSRSGDDVIRLGVTVVAEDAGGWSDHVPVELSVRPGWAGSRPKFAAETFKFEVEASASVGHVIGTLSLTGSDSSALFSVRHPSEYFNVDLHSGRLMVARDLRTLPTTDSQVNNQRCESCTYYM